MTRMEKYRELRIKLANERYDSLDNYIKYVYILNHQEEIKKELRCKH